jgi:hypothetical protein
VPTHQPWGTPCMRCLGEYRVHPYAQSMTALPDLNRVGGLEWTRRTNGNLTRRERMRMLGDIARGQAEMLAGRVAAATGRKVRTPLGSFVPPDSAFAREVEIAAAEQNMHWEGHGHRTWWLGSALASIDGSALDPEHFYAAALLHDHGVLPSVAGEDFTLRSADRVARIPNHLAADDLTAIQDGITVHATAGISVERDGALGFYTQAGAMADIVGLRTWELTSEFIDSVLDKHPRTGMTRALIDGVSAESRALPKGRFALLRRCGFIAAGRLAPYDKAQM